MVPSNRIVFERKSPLPHVCRVIWGSLCAFVLLMTMGCGGKPEPTAEQVAPVISPPAEPERTTAGKRIPAKAAPPAPPVSKMLDDNAPIVQKLIRPADRRPTFDDQELAKHGIRRFESPHLKLYTDIDPAIAETLPPVIDEAYETWEAYFGNLPPAADRAVFQMTGYIMADRELFRNAGLLPQNLPGFRHGRHRGAEFWMNDQQDAYFRRHLMIHEATHCFMTIMPSPPAAVWYLEGMAELFGTHGRLPDGEFRFGVIPSGREGFEGWARFRMIQDEIKAGRALSFDDVLEMTPDQFVQEEYAWAWALCLLLERHPRYHSRFRQLAQQQGDGDFGDVFYSLFNKDFPDIREEWRLLLPHLKYGYNAELASIEWRAGEPLEAPVSIQVESGRGWQSSGVTVEKGVMYHVTANGRFTVAEFPKPWVSEPQGVSIRYVAGRPLGQLLACIREEATQDPRGSTMFDEYVIGMGTDLTAPVTGTLYFRVNDDWSELFDNSGTLDVEIQQAN